MDLEKFHQLGKCCTCEAGLKESKHDNAIMLDLFAEWDYPTAGNLLTNEHDRAIAFVCDNCFKEGFKEVGRIRFAVEFNNDEIIYHDIKDLKPVENEKQD